MCISTTWQPSSAAIDRLSAAPVKAVTSFQMPAPADAAARMTPGFMVSIEMGAALTRRTPSITGRMRAISSDADTGSAPGRVDSPPMSSISAPCSSRARA